MPSTTTADGSSNGTRINQSRNEKGKQYHQRPARTREADESQVHLLLKIIHIAHCNFDANDPTVISFIIIVFLPFL